MNNERPLAEGPPNPNDGPPVNKQEQLPNSAGADHASIDYSDPVAVRDLICRINPFGEILRYEGIVEVCRLGRGRELVEMSTPPHIPQPDLVPIAEMMDPPIEWIMSIEPPEHRAFVILKTGFYGTDEAHRAAIESVRDAGVVGLLAQANLQPPIKPKRRKSNTRRYGRAERAHTPNLFKAFED
jgi:hypothetical protein